MKKTKKDFTLDEIMNALGVIGVVTAITIPTVAHSINKAKIGPTLTKVITQIETGNKNIINFANSQPEIANSGAFFDRLSSIRTRDLGLPRNTPILNNFQDVFPPHWSVDRINTLNGITVRRFNGNIDNTTAGRINGQPYYKFKNLPAEIVTVNVAGGTQQNINSPTTIGIYVDINGWNTGPNTVGKDIFAFRLVNNGILIPLVNTEAGDYAQQIINDGFKVTYY